MPTSQTPSKNEIDSVSIVKSTVESKKYISKVTNYDSHSQSKKQKINKNLIILKIQLAQIGTL